MNEQTIVTAPTQYKLEEIYDLSDAPFYQHLQIDVSFQDSSQSVTDTLRQFISHKNTYIPCTEAKEMTVLSLNSGYSAVVRYSDLQNDGVKLLYYIKKNSPFVPYVPLFSNLTFVTQVAHDYITTTIDKDYTVPILNGTTVASMLKIKAVLFKYPIPKNNNPRRARHDSDDFTSNNE
jgi:hypothetical protein